MSSPCHPEQADVDLPLDPGLLGLSTRCRRPSSTIPTHTTSCRSATARTKMTKLVPGQEVDLVKDTNYKHEDAGKADGINFISFSEDTAAYTAVQGDQLDYAAVPTAYLKTFSVQLPRTQRAGDRDGDDGHAGPVVQPAVCRSECAHRTVDGHRPQEHRRCDSSRRGHPGGRAGSRRRCRAIEPGVCSKLHVQPGQGQGTLGQGQLHR